jgi:hypothetical protein
LNYLALAAGVLAALIALRAVLIIVTVSTGKKKYAAEYGFIINAAFVAVFGTLAIWLFGMVAA